MGKEIQASKNTLKWPYLVLAVLTFALYSNTLKHNFVLDDDVVFLQNSFVQEGVQGIDDILTHGFLYGFNQRNDQSYRPLVLIDYAIQKSLFGNSATAQHFLNILYYAILICLVFAFFKKLMPNQNHWMAFWIALLFLFHPIHTEVVANIKGRDEILHAIFALISMYYSFRFMDEKQKKYLLISLLSFFAALLCKEIAVTLIVLIPLTIYFFRNIEWKDLFKVSAYYAAVLVLYLFIRQLILDDFTFEDDMTVINNGLAAASSLSERIASNFVIFGKYISLLFFPHPLSWDYSVPYFPIVNFGYPLVILITLSLITAVIFALKGIESKNKYAWSIFFFLISFSIVSNFFILIGATLGERFLFFPSLAFCFFIVIAIKDIDQNFSKRKRKYELPIAVIALILMAFAVKTFDRNKDWENNESLFRSGVEATPNNSRAVSALASVYRERGETATNPKDQQKQLIQARDLYLESIKLFPDNTDALYNLGVCYTNLSNRQKARMAYERVLELSPNHVRALNNMGVIYFQRSEFDRAAELFLKALEVSPNFQSAHANLGAVYHNKGERQKAQQYYQRALELNPGDVNTRNNLQKLLN